MKPVLDKLTIGTVNFGMPYGVVPGAGQVPEEEVTAILASALEKNIDRFDTAIGYGTAEDVVGRVLGKAKAREAKVVTKILPLSGETLDEAAATEIVEQICQARDRLGVQQLDAVLVHRTEDLIGSQGRALWDILQRARDDGLVRKIGVSVYDASDIDAVLDRFNPGVVQLPVSLADQRLIGSGHLQKLAEKGVEVHARSVFLQGVLLAGSHAVDALFGRAVAEIEALDAVARAKGVSRLALCLSFVAQLPQVSRVVVGVNSADQFHEVVAAASRAIKTDVSETDACAWKDAQLLNPSHWPKLKETTLFEAE